MATLSAQLAYLFYLGDQAASQDVKQWNIDFLTKEVIAWAQHVDILWPTLSDDEKKTVLNQAQQIYTDETHRYGQNIIRQQLVSSLWSSCHSAILLHVIANRNAPDMVLAEAIQRFAKSIDNSLKTKESDFSVNVCVEASAAVSRFLQQGHYCQRIMRINNVMIDKLAEQSFEQGESNLLIRYVSKKKTESCISIGLTLISLCNDASVSLDVILSIVSKMFYIDDAKRVLFRNSLLFVCIYKKFSDNDSRLTKKYAQVQQSICELFYALLNANVQTAAHTFELLTSYDSYSLAQVCKWDNNGKFAHAYLSQLLDINEKSQKAMLNDYTNWGIEDAEDLGSDSLIFGLVEKWQHLLVLNNQQNRISECLQNDNKRFDKLKIRLGKVIDNPGVIAIVNFWDAFYDQFKTR